MRYLINAREQCWSLGSPNDPNEPVTRYEYFAGELIAPLLCLRPNGCARGCEYQVAEFMQDGEGPGSGVIRAIDDDCRHRRVRRGKAPQYFDRHGPVLHHEDAEPLDRVDPCTEWGVAPLARSSDLGPVGLLLPTYS